VKIPIVFFQQTDKLGNTEAFFVCVCVCVAVLYNNALLYFMNALMS